MITRKTIYIRKPFYGAGSEKKYNWVKDGYNIWGVGIDTEIINKYDSLDIILDKKHYRVSTQRIKEFTEKYGSYYSVPNYTKVLGVFSISIMRNITAQDKKEEPKPEPPKSNSNQGTLL